MEPSREIGRLIEIMAALREPSTGCPWDLEQDFSTIAPYTVEEAYEVADAIERGDPADLREELGDLLLQVVYHSQLAHEASLFSFGDVVESITSKMIRRHPHVFGDHEARTAGAAKGQWERIKAEEKAETAQRRISVGADQLRRVAGLGSRAPAGHSAASDSSLSDIPSNFPALMLALKVQNKAARVGFDWTSCEPIRAKLLEELAEFDEAVAAASSDEAEAELGDVLFSLVNLARFHGINPEAALRRTVAKFRRRFAFIEARLRERGRLPQDATLDEMEQYWVEAKTATGVEG